MLHYISARFPYNAAWSRDPLLEDLVATAAFQRLKAVHFLGGIDYLLVPSPNGAPGNMRHTRYQHSLGVAQLALFYSQVRDLPFSERRHVSAAALLHDIGHAPLSHSLEPVFEDVFGLEHHRATANILTGRVPLGREVYDVLCRHGANIELLAALIAGDDRKHHGFFSGPINLDTIEGILRTLRYAKHDLSAPAPRTIVNAALRRVDDGDRRVVDEFWQHKDFVYRHIINSVNGILADHACQLFMRQALGSIRPDDYYSSEQAIFRKLPGLRELLTSRRFSTEIMKYLDQPITYTARHFFIVSEGDFYGRNDSLRYQQSREVRAISPRGIELALSQDRAREAS